MELGNLSADEDDDSAGVYLHAGVIWDLSESFFLGIDARGLFGTDIDIVGFDTDVDYTRLAIIVGLSF